MKKFNVLIISSLPLLLAACQSQDAQSIQENDHHSPIKITAEEMEDAYHNKDAFKKTISLGTSEIQLPLQGVYLNQD